MELLQQNGLWIVFAVSNQHPRQRLNQHRILVTYSMVAAVL